MAPRARVFRIVAGYTPPSGSGSYQRVRGRTLHSPRSTRSCSEHGGISRRSRRRKVAGRTLDAQKKQFPPCPPPPDPTTNCPRDCIVNLVNIPISVVRWHDAAHETLSIYNLAPPPVFVCLVMKSASRLHIFFAYRWRGMSSRPRMFQQQPLIHVRAKEPVPP
jgi:hypothetical protein